MYRRKDPPPRGEVAAWETGRRGLGLSDQRLGADGSGNLCPPADEDLKRPLCHTLGSLQCPRPARARLCPWAPSPRAVELGKDIPLYDSVISLSPLCFFCFF